jgi:hypothetical protein
LTEQLYTNQTTATNEVPFEPKTKRIKVLRLLALKAAALSDWDLLLFEKEFVLSAPEHLSPVRLFIIRK